MQVVERYLNLVYTYWCSLIFVGMCNTLMAFRIFHYVIKNESDWNVDSLTIPLLKFRKIIPLLLKKCNDWDDICPKGCLSICPRRYKNSFA